VERELALRAIIATSPSERWCARSLDKPRVTSSRASWQRSGRIA
jgi:hypothetical protein